MEKAIIKYIKCTFDLNDGKFYHKIIIHECEKTKEDFYWFDIKDRSVLISLDKLENSYGLSHFSCFYYTTDLSDVFEKEMFSQMHTLINEKCEELKKVLEKSKFTEFITEN